MICYLTAKIQKKVRSENFLEIIEKCKIWIILQ